MKQGHESGCQIAMRDLADEIAERERDKRGIRRRGGDEAVGFSCIVASQRRASLLATTN